MVKKDIFQGWNSQGYVTFFLLILRITVVNYPDKLSCAGINGSVFQ